MSRLRTRGSKALWGLQDAKNRFSEVINAALRGVPQIVTRRGVETAVVISHDDYTRMVEVRSTRRASLGEYLVSGVQVDSGDPFERIKLNNRDPA